ncbi:MAG TPA: SMP-30/gluconolactonase/LRE family protein, partial [Candidatus Limnocylindrales bacterium]
MRGQPVQRVVFDERFHRLVPAATRVEHLAGGAAWAEGPVYLPDQDAVIWSDVRGDRVHRWTAAGGDTTLYSPGDFANGHTLDRDGHVLACEHGRRRIARYEADGTRTTVVDRYEGRRLNSPNDLVVASGGAVWFTDPPYGILDDSEGHAAKSELGGCFVFRLDRDTGELAIASDAMVHPNGLAFSPDESVL